MASRRALVVFVLALMSLQTAWGSVDVGCHPAARQAAVAAGSAEEMPCHGAVDASTSPSASGHADAPRAALRAADCCTAHQTCAACSAPSVVAVVLRSDVLQHHRDLSRGDGAFAEVARDGRTLDHIPL